MKFNKIWTKGKNDLLRKFNRENRTVEFIKEYFGNDLEYHPKGRYSSSKLSGFHEFVNEIKVTPESINYVKNVQKSIVYNKKDYIFNFSSNVEYTLLLIYVENFGKSSYEIVFTDRNNYDNYVKVRNDFMMKGYLTEDDNKILSNIIEQKTNFNEIYSLMRKISFILLEEYPIIKLMYKIPLSITETNDLVKIRLYRNIIKDSFPDFIETMDKSELNIGKQIFYYE